MPAAAAMACTASGRSPDSSSTRNPRRRRAPITSRASGRSVSRSSRRPARPCPGQPTQTSVSLLQLLLLPLLLLLLGIAAAGAAANAASRDPCADAHRSTTHSRRPTATCRSPTSAQTPLPGSVCELPAAGTSRPARWHQQDREDGAGAVMLALNTQQPEQVSWHWPHLVRPLLLPGHRPTGVSCCAQLLPQVRANLHVCIQTLARSLQVACDPLHAARQNMSQPARDA